MENTISTAFPPIFITGASIAGILACVLLMHWVLRVLFAKNAVEHTEAEAALFPRVIRIWHWLNVGFFVALLVTGVSAWLKLGPKGPLINAHIVIATVYIFLWVFFIAYNMLGNGRNYTLSKGVLSRGFRQARYYLIGVFKGESAPHHPEEGEKFNALQQLSYGFIMYGIMPIFIATGLLQIIKPIHVTMLRTHIFFCTFISVLFVIIHLYMVLSNKTLKNMSLKSTKHT